jgi:hypothetical protein
MREENQLNQETPGDRDAGAGLVFYVGPPRSGSKTAAWALALLDYPASHEYPSHVKALDAGDWGHFLDSGYRMFADGLWQRHARLYDRFPQARYFCFLRSPDEVAWSLYRYSRHQQIAGGWTNVTATAVGVRAGYENLFKYFADAGREQFHCQAVAEGWGPLCAWLGVPVPGVAFPHSNKSWCLGDAANIAPPQGLGADTGRDA